MSAATNQAQKPAAERSSDPSMEEILASIRRIISDEQGVPLSPRPPKPESPAGKDGVGTVPADVTPLKASSPEPDGQGESSGRNNSGKAPPLSERETEAQPASDDPASERRRAAARAVVESDVEFESWLRQATGAGKAMPGTEAADDGAEPEQSAEFDPAPHEDRAADGPGAIPPELEEAAQPRLAVVSPRQEGDVPPAGRDDGAPGDSEEGPGRDGEDPASSAGAVAGDELERPISGASAEQPLLSPAAGASVASSFQALTQTMFMQNSHMVEDAVKEMLQPMLKQWLDDNLPVIVERLVRAEIERVARGG